jgi:hypothetical protein
VTGTLGRDLQEGKEICAVYFECNEEKGEITAGYQENNRIDRGGEQ